MKTWQKKTSGWDNIPSVIWKHEKYHEDFLFFYNETFLGRKPSAFSESYMITIAKKRDITNPSNYRGITLTGIAAKV